MSEEILDALSSIAYALDIFKPANPWEELITFWTDEGRVKIAWNQHERVYLHKRINQNEVPVLVEIVEITVLTDKNEAVLKAALAYHNFKNRNSTIKALEIAESL